MSEIISLAAHKSAREPDRRLFRCIGCGSYSFKVIEINKEMYLGCANCETWIQEFELHPTRDDL